jgi:mannosyltransferase OCH1-like enzyme
MIPKIIHYCWFGKGTKSLLIKQCIESWEKYCPDYKIIEWNEENFDVTSHPFTARMYKEKKFAFVTDYVRLVALLKDGGVYLDTDMLLLQPIDVLLETSLLLGKESEKFVSCGMIGAIPHHTFIEAMRRKYDTLITLRPNPVIMTKLYENILPENTLVMAPHAFYPYDSDHIQNYKGQELSKDVYGVHLWNYSWGHPLNKFFKKIGIYRIGKKITETLGIKKLLKKLLGFV